MRIFSTLAIFLFSLALFAVEPAPSAPINDYSEGKDYFVLTEPLRTADTTKIEVAEVFAYPCHACFNFEATLENWVKKQQADVNFVRTHVSFRPDWPPYQRGYYTVLSLHLKEDISKHIFNAIHVEHKKLNTAQAWADFLVTYGVDKQTVTSTYDSFAVNSKIKQADAHTRGYKIEATPTLIVDGKYKVSNTLNSYDDTLKVTQFLVDKVRAERLHQ